MKKEMEVVKYQYKDDIETKYRIDGESYFENESALSLLLSHEQIVLNNHWWEDTWDEGKKNLFYVGVNCNDIFAWGCADAEELMFHELEDLFSYWEKDKGWGMAVWCMIKRKEMPQKSVYDRIQKVGIWNLDELQKEYNLQDNLYDKFLQENKLGNKK